MSEFDDLMQTAWQTAQPPGNAAALAARVRRHRWRRVAWRGLEIVLTLMAVALLARPLFGGATTPGYWLVLPFFVAYLPIVWWLLLRNAQPVAADTTRDVRTYASIRLSQVRAGLRELRIARIAASVLLAYAGIAMGFALSSGDAHWRGAATALLACAGACALATFWLSRRLCRRRLREYRAMRRVVGHRG